MPKLMRKLAVMAKVETTSGTDSVPVAATNAILLRNASITPLEMTVENRDLVRSYLGNSDQIIVSRVVKMEFEVELAGAGAAGTVPKYGVLLRACGLSETVAAGVDVTYAPVSAGFETLSMYFNLDGVQQRLTYGTGSVMFSLDAGKVPYMKFSFMGLFNAVTDVTFPTAVYTGFVKPVAVNKANTPTFTLHALAAVMESLQIDLKNETPYRNLVNAESVLVVDRKPAGSVSIEAVAAATKNWIGIMEAGTTGAMQMIHGTAAGNVVQFDAPVVQLFNPRVVNSQGVAMLQADTVFLPSAGNDELTLKVK